MRGKLYHRIYKLTPLPNKRKQTNKQEEEGTMIETKKCLQSQITIIVARSSVSYTLKRLKRLNGNRLREQSSAIGCSGTVSVKVQVTMLSVIMSVSSLLSQVLMEELQTLEWQTALKIPFRMYTKQPVRNVCQL